MLLLEFGGPTKKSNELHYTEPSGYIFEYKTFSTIRTRQLLLVSHRSDYYVMKITAPHRSGVYNTSGCIIQQAGHISMKKRSQLLQLHQGNANETLGVVGSHGSSQEQRQSPICS